MQRLLPKIKISLSKAEMKPLLQGIALCFTLVIIGVAAAEYQLNSLTLRSSHNQSFNVTKQQGIYTIYVLGKSERFSGLYAQADFKQSAEKIELKHNLFSVTIPTKIQYNFEPIRHWPETWRKQFVAEAYKTKHSFLGYYHELEPSLTAARLWINDKINRIRQLLAGNRQ